MLIDCPPFCVSILRRAVDRTDGVLDLTDDNDWISFDETVEQLVDAGLLRTRKARVYQVTAEGRVALTACDDALLSIQRPRRQRTLVVVFASCLIALLALGAAMARFSGP